MLTAYQLIPPDGTEGETYLGEDGRVYVQRFCRHNPGWAWCECDPEPASCWCGTVGCVMPGEHLTSECHTVEMIEDQERG